MADHDTHDHTGVPGVGGASTLDALLALSTGEDIADALSGAAAPDAGNVFATMADVSSAGAGTTWLQKQTANNTSQFLDFTSFISSAYSSYLFVLNDLLMATDNVDFYLRVGTGGGPTYDTGTNYNWDMFLWRNGATGTNGGAATNQILLDDPGGGLDNGTTTQGLCGHIFLLMPVGTNWTQFEGKTKYRNNFGPSRVNSEIGAEYATTTAITAVRFMASSGNITRGEINCYGLKNT